MALAILLLVAVLSLLALAVLSCWSYGTWRRKGVPYATPWPVFGSLFVTITQMEPLFKTLDRLCRRYPGEKYFGFYAGASPVLMVLCPEIIKDITVKVRSRLPNAKDIAASLS